MANRVLKSVLWFAGITTIGFGLFAVVTPSNPQYTKVSKVGIYLYKY